MWNRTFVEAETLSLKVGNSNFYALVRDSAGKVEENPQQLKELHTSKN